jgi:VWFA-related protein
MCSRPSPLLLPLFLATTLCTHNLLFAQSTPSGSAETSHLTYRRTVSEVRLVFFATDEHNHFVEKLRRDDFAVVDDERIIREFRSFTCSDLVKLNVVVVVDSSESVLPQMKKEISEVERLISQSPWRPGDNLSVLLFDGEDVRLICDGDCDKWFTSDRFTSSPRGGPTPLFDAVEVATKLLIRRRQPDVWPVIILFSDGDDNVSKASFQDAFEQVLLSEAQVYAIDVNRMAGPSNGTAVLQKLADDSGGRLLPLSEGAVRIFNDVIDDLHSARLVTYLAPESDSDFHSVRILPTRNLKLQFRSRRGYYRRGSAHSEDNP